MDTYAILHLKEYLSNSGSCQQSLHSVQFVMAAYGTSHRVVLKCASEVIELEFFLLTSHLQCRAIEPWMSTSVQCVKCLSSLPLVSSKHLAQGEPDSGFCSFLKPQGNSHKHKLVALAIKHMRYPSIGPSNTHVLTEAVIM